MTERRTISRTAGVTALAAVALAMPLPAQRSRISGNIDNLRTVTLRGHVNPNARPEFDQGPVDDAFALDDLALALKPSAAQQADLASLLAAQQDPASPDYHKWLTPSQFAGRFGASGEDVGRVTAWLESQGFTVRRVAPSRNWIAFSGPAGAVRRAFRAEIHRYRVNGRAHFANSSDPSAPAALADLVAAIRGLDDFLPRVPGPQPLPRYTAASGNHYLAPDDAATIYNLKSLYQNGYDGTGQKLAVAGQSALETADVRAFRTLFGLPDNSPQVVLIPGSSDPGIVSGDVVEADLDVEWAGAIARNATVVYVYARNAFDAVQYAIAQNLAPVLGLSYGTCEDSGSTAATLRLLAQQANAQGITWIAASGDAGAFGCESASSSTAQQGPSAGLPASIPEVTGVGGTSFSEGAGTYWSSTNGGGFGSALAYVPETAWNETATARHLASSGGGPSDIYSKPTWQRGTGVPNDEARDTPDLAMPAGVYHDGAIVCAGGSCANGLGAGVTVVGGTSLSAQLFAGITALVNHYRVASGAAAQAGLANINPVLYGLAASHREAFHDIVSGDNVEPCRIRPGSCATGSFGYTAGVGYDMATGLGSVDAYTLALEWNSSGAAPPALSSVTISPSAIAGGASAVVAVALTGPAPPGGADVTLTSGNPTVFPTPPDILVPAGQTSAGVTVQAAAIPGTVTVSVTATYAAASRTASVRIGLLPPTLTAVTVTPSNVRGGATASVSVSLSGPALPGGASVALSSSSSVFPVPAEIAIAAGQTGGAVTVQAAVTDATVLVAVTATYNSTLRSASVTVGPEALPALTGLSVTPAVIMGGDSAVLTVTLSGPAPANGASVGLSSSSAAFPAPPAIVVPAGEQSAHVSVQAAGVASATAVVLTASYNGARASAGLMIVPGGPPASITLRVEPRKLTGGFVALLEVALSRRTSTGGASVSLSSNNAAFPVPAGATIPAGRRNVFLRIRTATVYAATPVTVTAVYGGASATADVTLTPVEAPTLDAVTVVPSSPTGGFHAFLFATLSGPAPPGGASVSLSSSDAAFPVPAAIEVPGGRKSAWLDVRTSTVTATTAITVTATYNGVSRIAVVTLQPVAMPALTNLVVAPANVPAGAEALLAVSLGGPAPPGGAVVSLSSSNPAVFPVPASIVVPAGFAVPGFGAVAGVRVRTQLGAAAPVTVTATYNGATRIANVTVVPVPPPALGSILNSAHQPRTLSQSVADRP